MGKHIPLFCGLEQVTFPLMASVSSANKTREIGFTANDGVGSLRFTGHCGCPHFPAVTGHSLPATWRAVISPKILLTKLRAEFPLEKSSSQEQLLLIRSGNYLRKPCVYYPTAWGLPPLRSAQLLKMLFLYPRVIGQSAKKESW